MKTKYCPSCKIGKNRSEFYRDKSTKDGLHSFCKVCVEDRRRLPKGQATTKRHEQTPKRKANKKRNSRKHEQSSRCKAYRREYFLKYTYGITLADYDEMLEQQHGVCVICGGVNFAGQRLCVDHDHVTGEVRGLLCHNCNLKLGWYDKNKQDVDNYLEGK